MRLIQDGPRDAKIMLVGEAPGATEDTCGIPFSGGSGELLNRSLSRVGISRSSCFVTNVCHTRPPKNEFVWFTKPIRPELIQGLIQLKADLEAIRPNVVVAFGTWPLKFLTGKTGIDKWRGSILPCTLVPGLKVIGTYHPAYWLRVYEAKTIAEFDLDRVHQHSTLHELRHPHRHHEITPTRETLLKQLPKLVEAPWLACDVECFEADTPTGWKLSCCGFSPSPDYSITVEVNEPWQRQFIREVLAGPSKKIFQNGAFDWRVLTDEGYVIENWIWDTMIAHHARFPECAGGDDELSALLGKKKTSIFRKGLAFQTSIYTEEPFYKDDGKLWKESGDINQFWTYNGKDCCVTREIQIAQEEQLKAFGTLHIAEEALLQSRSFMAITARGINIDLDKREKLKAHYEQEIINLQNALNQMCGEPVNVKSPKQMTHLLYETFKLPKKYGKTNNLTADKDAINALAGKFNHPFLKIILAIRQRRDFVERYMDAQVGTDGKMHCFLDVTGTRTGRLSSRQSIDGSGMNLQNVPARSEEGQKIRGMFIPDEGHVFVYCDYSQAEARIVAYLARCQGLIELFGDSTRDVHTENASRIFGINVLDVTPEQRYKAKRVVHACNYGMGGGRLVELMAEDGVYITQREADQLITRYFMLYPEIKSVFWREVENELRYSRTLNTPFGRKREFFGRWDEKLMREAYAYVPQSIVGDLGRKALYSIHQELELKEGICHALLNVHDSVLVQCIPNNVSLVANRMQTLMTIQIEIHGETFAIPTDCKVGRNWQDRPKKSPELNPNGLVELSTWLEEQHDT